MQPPRQNRSPHEQRKGPGPARAQLNQHRRLTYGDQKGQVDYLINHVFDYQSNGLPRGGYFVDLACADGVEINNTFFLEKWLGWTGLLFEPNPHFWPSIRKNRRSQLVTDCVSDTAGQSLSFRVDNGMSGGIVSPDTDNNPEMRAAELDTAEVITVETTTLLDELIAAGAPEHIDFLSLDIEGAEFLALKNFDFDRFTFRCAAIERPKPELDMLLDANGYRQVHHTKYDVIYVHKAFVKEINWTPNAFFAFTPPKDW